MRAEDSRRRLAEHRVGQSMHGPRPVDSPLRIMHMLRSAGLRRRLYRGLRACGAIRHRLLRRAPLTLRLLHWRRSAVQSAACQGCCVLLLRLLLLRGVLLLRGAPSPRVGLHACVGLRRRLEARRVLAGLRERR